MKTCSWSVFKVVMLLLAVLLVLVPGLSCVKITVKGKDKNQTVSQTQVSKVVNHTRPHPPVRTGNITLGKRIEVVSQMVDKTGGIIGVDKPGDPLNGFVISVLPDSYSSSRTFKVSYAPITKHTFGRDINPISPMITVDNGGGYSEEIMYLRVPVNVPKGHFAMGFIYDEKSKQLEGLPLVGMDSESLTIATRHFSSFFISSIEEVLLKKDVDSGFRPGIDDWHFVNYGSYIAPDGHCEGQSLTAMWYYCTSPDGKDACLYGRYDNNGNSPATPDLQLDDSLGYRFCSVVQEENRNLFANNFWLQLQGKKIKIKDNEWSIEDTKGISAGATFNLFVYSIRATGEPQEVGMHSYEGGGHAMIVYKVADNELYVADPNYPGDKDRRIIYYPEDNYFDAYDSGANREDIDAGDAKFYETIQYWAKTTVVPWDIISNRWTEFKNGTIGNNEFPQWQLYTFDSQGKQVNFVNGFETNEKLLAVGAFQPPDKRITYQAYIDGAVVKAVDGKIPLKPGNNNIGFVIWGWKDGELKYIDFKYFNVVYREKEQPPKASQYYKITITIPQNYSSLIILDASGREWPKNYQGTRGSDRIIFEPELPVGTYILRYSCFCYPSNAPQYTVSKEFEISVGGSSSNVYNLACPQCK